MLQEIEDLIKKNLNRKSLIVSILIGVLAITLAFGLGLMAGQNGSRAPIIIQKTQ